MKKSQIFFGLAILAVVLYGIDTFSPRALCYEIVKVANPIQGDMLLDKCKGRTWTMVNHETTLQELGYISDGDDKPIRTVVWSRVEKGSGVVSFGEVKK